MANNTETGMNEKLGLPFGKMERVAICFDVDGTLINEYDENPVTTNLLSAFTLQSWKNLDVIVWSGGGKQYAETMFREYVSNDTSKVKFYSKLQLGELQARYAKIIAIDDIQDTAIGDVNLIVRNK